MTKIMTNEEKNLKLQEAKRAYYEGNPIMGDEEYDALEKELNLENASNVGYHSENYTVKHPVMMGSLSKIQVKNDDGKTWDDYVTNIKKYLKFWTAEVTPKFDGCSFELVLDSEGWFDSCSTRGDGVWGKDIKDHLKSQLMEFMTKFQRYKNLLVTKYPGYIIRGEVLIKNSVYEAKYKDSYVNTRAFVAGSLNNDSYQESDEDLFLMFYDFRSQAGKHLSMSSSFIKTVKEHLQGNVDICIPEEKDIHTGANFEKIYKDFEVLREGYDFPLDGIVFKTQAVHRDLAISDERPKDCVAIKFAPAIVETEIVDIEWNYSHKTAEYFPVGIIKPVILDSKTVTRVSLHNFGYIFENKVTPGAKVKISMAGDIIPFLYEVIEPSETLIVTPLHTFVDGVHLYKIQTENEKQKAKFLASCDILNIKGLGPSLAEVMYEFQQVDHVLMFNFERFAKEYVGKTSTNLYESFHKFIKDMSLAQLIESLAIPFCGERMSKECAKYMMGQKADFSSMASAGYFWIYNSDSPEYVRYAGLVKLVSDMYGKVFVAPEPKKETEKTIKVVLTGSPKEFGYKTKAEFLSAHPELEEVSNLKDADMLVTDDLNSTSSKMQKAAKLGKEIKTYGL